MSMKNSNDTIGESKLCFAIILLWGTAVAQWLRRCVTNRNVACPNWCQWNFNCHKILPIALYVPGAFTRGKGVRCVRLQPTTILCRCHENLGNLTSWNPLGLSRPVMGLLYLLLSDIQNYKLHNGFKTLTLIKMVIMGKRHTLSGTAVLYTQNINWY